MKQVGHFILTNAKASLWLIYYIVIQSIVGSGIIIWFAFHDYDFGTKFLELYEPVVKETNFFKQQQLSLEAMMELCSGKIGYIMGLSSAITILGILLVSKIRKKQIFKKIILNELFLYLSVGVVLNLLVTFIVNNLPPSWTSLHSQLTSQVLTGGFLVNVIGVGILGPVTEELIFRYGMQQSLYKVNVTFAIVYQAILFGAFHGNLVQALYGCVLGLLFGYIYYKKKSIVYTVLLHIGVNLSSVIAANRSWGEIHTLFFIGIITWSLYAISKQFAFCQKRI